MTTRFPGRATFALLLVLVVTAGCREATLTPPPVRPWLLSEGGYPDWPLQAGAPLRPVPGTYLWAWQARDGSPQTGSLLLHVTSHGWWWEPALAGQRLPRRLHLEPNDSTRWHGMDVTLDTLAAAVWFPLARRAVHSAHYADLLDLLLTLVRTSGTTKVVHWPAYPVTVGAGTAVSGEVDLAAALADGVHWWSHHLPGLFTWRPDTICAIRLIHIPGRLLQPPAMLRLLQRDTEGHPLRMQIRIGDTYDSPRTVRYARRALLHELTHAAGLWGHSGDRRHILWRVGPIVDVPDTDETLAVRWWLSLPEGLDLARYGRRGELDPEQ